MYVEHTVEVLREIRRVLRKDGVVWWDLDDSRGANWRGGGPETASAKQLSNTGTVDFMATRAPNLGIPAKSLCLIPQRVALAAQEDGWIVRSVIVIPTWMPESTKDRPTDAYRTVLVLTKSPRYWYDYYAVRQPNSSQKQLEHNLRYAKCYAAFDDRAATTGQPGNVNNVGIHSRPGGVGRNLSNVWNDIPPAGYPGAHFAAFHPNEPTRCILASCPPEICSECGKPRVRLVQKKLTAHDGTTESQYEEGTTANRLALLRQAARERGEEYTNEQETTGWTDCGCGAPFDPGLVLDPFVGTGTTAEAARELGRYCVGIDASEAYLEQAKLRLTIGLAGIRKIVAAERKAKQSVA